MLARADMRRRRSPLASALLWAGFLFQGALALDNRMGLTPAMGFNPWNRFRCKSSAGGVEAVGATVALASYRSGAKKEV